MTKSRLRTLALPLALAAAAATLIGIYMVSYRNSVTHGAGLVTVLVATRDIPAGTDGATIAGGGYLKSQTVPRRAVVPGSVTSASPLTSNVTSDTIYRGEQITLRQFVPVAQGGLFAKFSGNERIVSVPGDANQLLVGTLADGDHIDVVVTARYTVNSLKRAASRVVLRNLLVAEAPESTKATSVGAVATFSANVVMTDQQAQTLGWAMKQGTWFFALRPTNRPSNSVPSVETFLSIYTRGLHFPQQLVAGSFPVSTDEP